MRKHLMTVILLSILFVLGTGASAFAADSDSGSSKEAYNYKVFVYAGNIGTFKGVKEWSTEYENGGDVVTFSVNDVEIDEDLQDKYVVRGFKLAGHDNDETSYSPQITFNGGGDVSYVVSYRIPGDMVSYQVHYVAEDGSVLHDPDTFYGMVGDKPVISFRYIEGYLPNAYNLAKTLTLTRDGDNDFTFTYTAGSGTNTQTDDNGNTNGNTNGNANANAGNAGNAAGNAGNAAGIAANAPGTAGNPAGANTATIGDGSVPLASPDVPQYTDLDESSGINWPLILGISGGVVALALLLVALLLKRRKRGEGDGSDGPSDDDPQESVAGIYK